MTKELSKQTMKRSKSTNFYFKWLSTANILAYKNEKKNKSNYMTKNAKELCFPKVTAKKVVNHFGMQSNPFSLMKE